MSRTSLRPLAAFLFTGILAGCYSYAEVPPAALAPGRAVRVTVNDEQALQQRDALGGLEHVLSGEVVASERADVLNLTVRQRAGGPAARSAFNTFLTLPFSSLVRVEEKRFSVGRTAGVAGAAALIIVAVLAIESGGSGDTEGPPVEEIRTPLLRLRLR